MTEYEAFVDKFKPKLTTDDCYTPAPVFDAILSWAVNEYDLQGREIVRPFYPDGDYEAHDYPDGCVVIDNPPFSILKKITKFYRERGIEFFLFGPSLTLFSLQRGASDLCGVVTGASVTYENGAVVNTSFVTNLEPETFARTAPDLKSLIEQADKLSSPKQSLPKYVYPATVTSAARLNKLSRVGVTIPRSEARFVSALESQKQAGKTIFGGGVIVSQRVAAHLAEAEHLANVAKLEKADQAVRDGLSIVWEVADHETI